MKDAIFVVDPSTRQTVRVAPTTFSDLNMKERQDMQAWLINKPEVLGEPLLFITSEYDRFDRSDKRLDMLLLDRTGTLVVAELKLDASGTLADQQAIRYAAFCSTMTMEEVVDLHSKSEGFSAEAATEAIQRFLETPSLPELSGEPRVILVAGAFNDPELTSTVLWLRKFRVDISCVELTPYRYPGDEGRILLVPKVLIPLAEAHDYVVSVERKSSSEINRKVGSMYPEFFRAVLDEYALRSPRFRGPANPATQDYMPVGIGKGAAAHYEWLVRKRERVVDVALHFEAGDRDLNLGRVQRILDEVPDLPGLLKYEMLQGAWGRNWAQICFRIPYEGTTPALELAPLAADAMVKFMDATADQVLALF